MQWRKWFGFRRVPAEIAVPGRERGEAAALLARLADPRVGRLDRREAADAVARGGAEADASGDLLYEGRLARLEDGVVVLEQRHPVDDGELHRRSGRAILNRRWRWGWGPARDRVTDHKSSVKWADAWSLWESNTYRDGGWKNKVWSLAQSSSSANSRFLRISSRTVASSVNLS